MKIRDYGKSLFWQEVCNNGIRKDMRDEVLDKTVFSEGPILEIGCAAGNFAGKLKSRNRDFNYLGVDINEEKIKEAKAALPTMKFIKQDVLSDKFIDTLQLTKTIIAFQVLEHLGSLPNFKISDGREDIIFLSKLSKSTKVIFSVPNFKYRSDQFGGHMRWFDLDGWVSRYEGELKFIECWKVQHCYENKKNKFAFLFVAIKR